AFFGVTIEEIETVKNHPNADRLDVATLVGMNFQFVTGRDNYKAGDRVLYFPLDSLFPFALMEKMDLVREKRADGEVVLDDDGNPVIEGALRGKKHNRLRSIRLRGQLSQGLVGSLDLIEDIDPEERLPEVITEFLGVEKYDPPVVPCQNGNLHQLPAEIGVYDIEGADRYSEVAEKLMDRKCWITEKMEGMNCSITFRPHTGEIFVNQRKYTIVEKEGMKHMFWATFEKIGIMDFFKAAIWDCDSITMYGEFLGPGVQGNIYKFIEHDILFYDVSIDGQFVGVKEKLTILPKHKLVPILCAGTLTLSEWLSGRTIQDASNGLSAWNSKVRREGIVITPMDE
ncbi:unnamed protein product, partial [marine sediment metagenome]